ncbi:hypothetical protein SAMN04488117_10283 [Celeribacter baekdonensis]|uniref:Uncharacterized protein n=1 Tax=Celeribacter baekdonensis TaxID=875171 RepID=A0A1G7HV16_9RHOB|nr:hypothetical protein [Celeribacter baekdonensis]SDF04136.1 hypothetical protein SAMN04488117_10283 [Celeribacter baekdonensis]
MAHYKRKHPRTKPGRGYSANGLARRLDISPDDSRWLDHGPSWHNIIMNIRPMRRRTKAIERAAAKAVDHDELIWPLAQKPHAYYW